MVNQFGKFSSKVTELTKPLSELLSSKRAWIWDTPQEEAFVQVKSELPQSTVLALYDLHSDIKLSVDVSYFGLVLYKVKDVWKPQGMSETEMRYAQIEKEALALTWAVLNLITSH